MRDQEINRLSWFVLIFLSLTALAPVLFGVVRVVLTGHVQPPPQDEDAVIHIFQLSIVALLPVGITFLATADWKHPRQSVQRLAFPATAVVLALGILFYVEHVYLPAHGFPLPRPGLPYRLLHQLLAARNQ
jgi:hypothetical protein